MSALNPTFVKYTGEGKFEAGEGHVFGTGILPGDDAVVLKTDEYKRLISLAARTVSEIEQRHRRRGFTTGKKLWERQLLHQAKQALGLLTPDAPMPDRIHF